MELLDCALIKECAVIRSNTVYGENARAYKALYKGGTKWAAPRKCVFGA